MHYSSEVVALKDFLLQFEQYPGFAKLNAKGNGDSPSAENMEGWTEGIEAEGDPSDDDTARRWPQMGMCTGIFAPAGYEENPVNVY